MVGVVIELLALQAMFAMIGLDRTASPGSKRIKPALPLSQMRPCASLNSAINGVARQSFLARDDSEANGIGRGGRTHDAREAALVGRHPDPAFAVDLERIDGVGGQTRGVGGIMPEYLDDGAVRSRKIEAAVVGAEPHVALRVLGDGRHARRADGASAPGCAEGELADQAAWPGSITLAPPSCMPSQIRRREPSKWS